MPFFNKNTSGGDGLSPEDIQNTVNDARTRVNQLEIEGNKTEAAHQRIKVAIGLWTLVQQNSSRSVSVAQKHAVRWAKNELSEVDPQLLQKLAQQQRERPSADQTASESDGHGQAETAISNAREPHRTFDDLYGEDLLKKMNIVVRSVRTALMLEDHPAFKNQTVGNFLFTGPPGTGKSHAAEAVAYELRRKGLDFTYLPLKGSNLKSHLYGASQSIIEQTFEWADENGPTLMFLDELEEIATRDGHEETQAITNTILAATDGGEAYENVVVMGATNLPDQIDPALRSRFGNRDIEFTEPPESVKSEIIWNFIPGDGVTVRFDRSLLEKVDYTGMVGRDLKKAARRAIVIANAGTTPVTVTLQDVERAVREMRPKGATTAEPARPGNR